MPKSSYISTSVEPVTVLLFLLTLLLKAEMCLIVQVILFDVCSARAGSTKLDGLSLKMTSSTLIGRLLAADFTCESNLCLICFSCWFQPVYHEMKCLRY